MKPNIKKIWLRNKMASNNKFKQTFKYLGGGQNFSWPRLFN